MSRFEQLTVGQVRMPVVATAAGGSLVTATLAPAEVATIVVAAQTLTLTGVEAGDNIICVSTPITNSVAVVGTKVTAANTISMSFVNPTAGALTPTAGAYVFLVIKH